VRGPASTISLDTSRGCPIQAEQAVSVSADCPCSHAYYSKMSCQRISLGGRRLTERKDMTRDAATRVRQGK